MWVQSNIADCDAENVLRMHPVGEVTVEAVEMGGIAGVYSQG